MSVNLRLGGSRTVYSMQPVSTKLIDFELMKTLTWSSMLDLINVHGHLSEEIISSRINPLEHHHHLEPFRGPTFQIRH